MNIKIRHTKDLSSGLIFIFLGIIGMILAHSLPMGSASQMGAGYFPFILGAFLALLGLIIALRSLWAEGEAIKPWELRPLLGVLGGVLAFSFLIQPLGLVLAIFFLIVISYWGGWNSRFLEVFILFFILAGLAVGVFVYGLRLPIRVWPI